jgi:hypothetical protein
MEGRNGEAIGKRSTDLTYEGRTVVQKLHTKISATWNGFPNRDVSEPKMTVSVDNRFLDFYEQ